MMSCGRSVIGSGACEASPRDKTDVHVICEQIQMRLEFCDFHEALPNLTPGKVPWHILHKIPLNLQLFLQFFSYILRKNIFRLLIEKLEVDLKSGI